MIQVRPIRMYFTFPSEVENILSMYSPLFTILSFHLKILTHASGISHSNCAIVIGIAMLKQQQMPRYSLTAQ